MFAEDLLCTKHYGKLGGIHWHPLHLVESTRKADVEQVITLRRNDCYGEVSQPLFFCVPNQFSVLCQALQDAKPQYLPGNLR